MTEPWTTPGGIRSGVTPMTSTRPALVGRTADTGINSPASTAAARLAPTTAVPPFAAPRYRGALAARLTSTAVRSAAVRTVPAARSLVADHTGLVCELAPITRAPTATAPTISSTPQSTRTSSHRGREVRRGTGAPSSLAFSIPRPVPAIPRRTVVGRSSLIHRCPTVHCGQPRRRGTRCVTLAPPPSSLIRVHTMPTGTNSLSRNSTRGREDQE